MAQIAVPNNAAVELSSGYGNVLVIKNRGANPVYLGGDSGVTSTTGYQLDAADPPLVIVGNGPISVFARCAGGQTSSVHTLASTKVAGGGGVSSAFSK